MSTGKALAFASGVTVVSTFILTMISGMPAKTQFFGGAGAMFVATFVVMKFFLREEAEKSD